MTSEEKKILETAAEIAGKVAKIADERDKLRVFADDSERNLREARAEIVRLREVATNREKSPEYGVGFVDGMRSAADEIENQRIKIVSLEDDNKTANMLLDQQRLEIARLRTGAKYKELWEGACLQVSKQDKQIAGLETEIEKLRQAVTDVHTQIGWHETSRDNARADRDKAEAKLETAAKMNALLDRQLLETLEAAEKAEADRDEARGDLAEARDAVTLLEEGHAFLKSLAESAHKDEQWQKAERLRVVGELETELARTRAEQADTAPADQAPIAIGPEVGAEIKRPLTRCPDCGSLKRPTCSTCNGTGSIPARLPGESDRK